MTTCPECENRVPYSDFMKWARILALECTRKELEKQLRAVGGEINRATASHLRAIGRTTSMTSNSQARAQAGNAVSAAGERRMALKQALEIYDQYPEHTKEGGGIQPPPEPRVAE